MFCNGPKMDGGDTAYLGPMTIIEITIPRCQSSSAMTLDDAGGLAGPITEHSPSCLGIKPLRLLATRFNSIIWDNIPISEGMLPESLLLLNRSLSNDFKRPNSFGIFPVR